MANIVSENIYEYCLNEDLSHTIRTLEQQGYYVVDKCIAGDYTMLLIHFKAGNMYEIALTSFDQDFLTPQSQEKRPMIKFPPLSLVPKMKKKLKEWLNISPKISVGSMNKTRTIVYRRILKTLGFKVSDVQSQSDENYGSYSCFDITK